MTRRVALRHLLSRQITDGPHESPEFLDQGVPFLSVDNVIDGQLSFEPCRRISIQDHIRYSQKAKPVRGDVLITKAASVGRVACVNVDFEFNVWSPIAIIRPKTNVLADRYLYFFLQSADAQAQLQRGATSNTQQNIAMGDIASLLVPELPIVEQRAIADYLDTETARIDALIARKQRMIELHSLRRSTMIARAVTLGNVGTDVVATGNPFAPEVRTGWELQRLRHVVSEIVDTAHKTAPVVEGGEFLVVRTANVKAGTLTLEGAHYTDEDSWREWTARGVPRPGDVIFTREAPAGEACLVPEGVPLCIGQRTVLLRPVRTKVRGEWILHSLYSGAAQRFIEVLSKSTTVAHINMSDIPDIPIVVPPLAEQDQILHLIRAEVHRAQRVIDCMTRQITLLRERRQALITAVVTGELEISEVAA